MKKIINLHCHSHYSILDSLSTTKQIIEKTVENELPGVAITDHGNMNNYGHFYLEAREAGIKPILGCEFYFLNSVKKWKEKKEEADNNKKITTKERKQIVKDISKRYHLILLAKNKKGFENLNLLIHESYKNFYHRPRIDRKLLVKYSEGLICSSACIGGELQQAILQEKDTKYIDKLVNFYKDLFKDDYYLELQINEMEDQKICNQELIKLSRKHKIKKILTGDSHYTNLEDQKSHQTLLLMNSKSTYEDLKNKKMGDMNSGAWEFDTKRLYLKNYDEYNQDRLELDSTIGENIFNEMCENTFEIFEKIENYEIDNSVKLKDTNPEIKDKNKQLKINCLKKLEELKLHKNKEYKERLEFELDVIKQKELENYFFAVQSITNHAKNNMNMLIGPGRGSAAGSLVSYLLEITQIDPLRYNLYFERFLDVERYDYADIDIDFEDNDKIKEWILEEYKGESACISSYSTFHLFGLIKDLGRVYDIEDAKYWNNITKIVRKELSVNKELKINEVSYEEAIENSSTFIKTMKKYQDLHRDMKILMGKYRHIGKHAAGLIISENLIKNQPIMIIKNQNQTSLTEGMYDTTLSKFGFIKIDILGLKTLKIIHETLKIISNNVDKEKLKLLEKIHPDNINLKSKDVFRFIFQNKNLCGIFQFDTDSANQVIEKIYPEKFEDLVAINALNRPGPKQFVDSYADRKHEVKKVKYDHPLLQDILKETQGIILYQEQVMEISKQLAGYTLPEANNLRKAMGKKIEKLMKEHEEKFINGCIKNKISKKIARNLFDKIEEFAKYSFNKCFVGSNYIDRDNKARWTPNIEEMYLVKNDKEWAKRSGHIHLHFKYNREGYKKGYSLNYNNRKLYLNDIMDIRYEGKQDSFRIILENDNFIDVTANHEFPCLDKSDSIIEKSIDAGLTTGCFLFCNDGYDSSYKIHSKCDYNNSQNKYMNNKGIEGFPEGDDNPAFVDGGDVLFQKNRKILKDKHKECQQCKKEDFRLECHHKDGNVKHNYIENLIILCSSCHKKAHYKLFNRVKKGQKGRLTSFSKIVKIKHLGKRSVYDIEMKKPFHSVSVNKIIAKNSHSVAYSMIGYQCAYLKTLFSLQFYTALLRIESKDEKIDRIIKEIKNNGIKVIPLDISKSKKNFSVINGEIYYGFCNIKGVGEKAADTIIKARRKKDIKGFKDFLLNEHIDRRVCNKRVIEMLIQSFVFGKNIEDKLEFFSIFHEYKGKSKQTPEDKYEECKSNFMYLKKANELKLEYLSDAEKVKLEKKLYGTNLVFSCFSINNRREKINKLLKGERSGGFKDKYDYYTVKFQNVSIVQDKNNNSMAFLDIEDIYGVVKSAMIFSSNFSRVNVLEDEVYCIKGEGSGKFIIETNKNIDELFKN